MATEDFSEPEAGGDQLQQDSKALFNEEACATQIEFVTGCPPLQRPLAAQYGTTRGRRLLVLTMNIKVKASILDLIAEVVARQQALNEALDMESGMLRDMLAAGVTHRGWMLQPIMADLADRNEKLNRQQDRLGFWLESVGRVEDELLAKRAELRQLLEQGDEESSSDKESTIEKREPQEMQEKSVQLSTQQELNNEDKDEDEEGISSKPMRGEE